MTDVVAVLGAGSWGTALAMQLARSNSEVHLWGHDRAHMERLRETRENTDYLPGYPFAENITVHLELADAVSGAEYILVAIPSKGFRHLLAQLKPLIGDQVPIFWASKGFEIESGLMLHQIIEQEMPGRHYGVVSGPTFAAEVAEGVPAAIACAGNDPTSTAEFAEILRGQHFRAYTTEDIIGVDLGGALKNVLAIAVGVADGLGFGANTRAMLMTRGLSEIMRLAVELGAQRETLMGLAGLGDIILTCTDDKSRNRRFGLAIGRGKSIDQAEIEVGQTVEGLRAARAVYQKLQETGLELPILLEAYRVLYEGVTPLQAVKDLESRPQGAETD